MYHQNCPIPLHTHTHTHTHTRARARARDERDKIGSTKGLSAQFSSGAASEHGVKARH